MAQVFEVGKPVNTQASFVDVENKLAPGTHVFTLVVVDNDGNQSAPTRAVVTVRQTTTGPVGPVITGPITPTIPTNPIITTVPCP